MTEGESSNVAKGLNDLIQKVEGTLQPAIEAHVKSEEFSAEKDGLDFLQVKNTMLLSYLIDMTNHLQQKAKGKTGNVKRLTEMKTALEKVRPLEKKLKYQLDKLLSTNSNSSTFATTGDQQDPLSFRPNPEALKGDDDNKGLSSDDGEDDSDDDDAEDDHVDDDLAAARATLRMAGDRKSRRNNDDDDGVYRAPRLAAMPYPAGGIDDREKQKRLHKKMRATELAHTLREQYGDAPEQEDIHGGSEYGKQRDASRRLAETEREKTRFEEDNMVRLTTSRKHKKAKQKLLRDESSNLAAIADLGSLARSVSVAFDDKPQRPTDDTLYEPKKKKRKSGVQTKNSLQKALYGGYADGDGKKKKKTGRGMSRGMGRGRGMGRR